MEHSNENLSQPSTNENLNELKPNDSKDKLLMCSNDASFNECDNECDEFDDAIDHIFEREDSQETVLPDETSNIQQATACALPVDSGNDAQNGLQKLLNKQKMELACELRRLQYANRPVSNTESKNRLEQFFTETAARNDSANRTNRPTRDPAQFRSEATRNEINNLTSQHRVSNVLQMARQRLESVLQRMVTANTSTVSTINLPLPPIPPTVPLNQTAAYTNGLQASQSSIASVPSSGSNNLVVQSSDGSRNVFTPVTAWIPVATPAQQQQQPAGVPWLAAASDPLRVTIEQVRREQIIEEISELVHQQLVTSTLESEFRTRLENRVLQHLQNTGTDGDRTREFIRNIQQTEHVERNDFSHLGINNANAIADNLDSASTYQGSQFAQQQQQQQQQQQSQIRNATASNTREIRALKSEITELKSMMKLSFEMQLDMQRSLRQEIGALIAGTFKDFASNVNGRNNAINVQSALNSTRPANEGSCIICTEGTVDTVLYKCGHMCTCYTCSMTLKQTGRTCPVCRAPIKDILRTYRCNLE